MTFAVTYDFTNGTVADADEVNENFEDIKDEFNAVTKTGTIYNFFAPIGSIIAWAKNLTGVPALPTNYVECNGQTLSDSGSPLSGQVIPNLNASGGGTKRYLRGSTTSGATGGFESLSNSSFSTGPAGGFFYDAGPTYSGVPTGDTLSPFYEIVWIMRVK
mgnify:CR=1 FL=1